MVEWNVVRDCDITWEIEWQDIRKWEQGIYKHCCETLTIKARRTLLVQSQHGTLQGISCDMPGTTERLQGRCCCVYVNSCVSCVGESNIAQQELYNKDLKWFTLQLILGNNKVKIILSSHYHLCTFYRLHFQFTAVKVLDTRLSPNTGLCHHSIVCAIQKVH